MLVYQMKGYSGYAVQYSPFFDNKLAVASGSNFGLVGNGRLFIMDLTAQGTMVETNSFLTKDGLFDVAWNEKHENQVLAAQGDGSLRLFDITLQQYPIALFQEHQREVFSCNWNLLHKDTFVSSSWDGTVKVWTPARPHSMLTLLPAPANRSAMVEPGTRGLPLSNQQQHMDAADNKDCIYQAQFSPHDPNLVMSCSGNSYVSLFDLRQPAASNQQRFIAHSGLEALTCDFNKYRPHVIATGGVDKMVKVWDLRMVRQTLTTSRTAPVSINEMQGHSLAVRKVAWSPHHSNRLISTSYDMTCRAWHDLADGPGGQHSGRTNNSDPQRGCSYIFTKHSEFVFGADWSLWGQPGYVATTGWDGQICAWYALAR
ncbi:AaceriAGL190Wp [[Ashbya] aceris (nom. inval.)]|nr:AaceriAGL190Wp [[Ashbya] aceris (nom. inval.)]